MNGQWPRLLVTGAAGFVGTYVAAAAVARGYSVHGADLIGAPGGMPDGVQDHRICDGHLAPLIASIRPDICIHAAGLASVRGSVIDPVPDFAAGPALTFSVLDALRRHAPTCRLLFLSSAAVYGNPLNLPVSEDAPAAPISPYGFHKLQSELLCREFAQVYGMRTAVARIFSAYGEGLRRQVLWDICRKALVDRQLVLMGTGRETRDFLHVSDIARGLLQIVANAPMAGEAYNLASGEAVSISDLAVMALRAMNSDIAPQFDGTVPVGDPIHWQADTAKLAALGFAPAVGLDVGVRAYGAWARAEMAADPA